MKLKIRKKRNDSKLIGNKFKHYIDFGILVCCLIIIFNIHAINTTEISSTETENKEIKYIFHDYNGNEYILNDSMHGSSDTLDFLFDDEVPDSIKGKDNSNYTNSVSLSNNSEKNNTYGNSGTNNSETKDNQVSIEDILSDLGINSDGNNDYLIISLSNDENKNNDRNDETSYTVKEESNEGENSTLIIEKITDESNDNINENGTNENDTNENKTDDTKTDNDSNLLNAKRFEYVSNGWVIPILAERNELNISKSTNPVEYNDSGIYSENSTDNNQSKENDNNGITTIDNYADCSTPRGYTIVHGDSVLAYKQLENAPNICNIERRYCRNGKLSGTYTQQGCSVNKNYTYNQRGEVKVSPEKEEIKGGARQNPNGTVTIKNEEIGGGFVFDRPNRSKTEFGSGDNIRNESEGINQTDRPYRDCTAPRGEKVKHGQYIQAFKHSNGFSDSPCEIQLRLCSMGELLGTYTQSTCKTRDTSFIDWVNGSPTRETYSKEKLDLIKKQIRAEQKNYEKTREDAERSTNSDALEKILRILDQD